MALYTGEHGHEDDPHRDKQAQDDYLFVVLTRPPDSEADALFVWGHSRETAYAAPNGPRPYSSRPRTPAALPAEASRDERPQLCLRKRAALHAGAPALDSAASAAEAVARREPTSAPTGPSER